MLSNYSELFFGLLLLSIVFRRTARKYRDKLSEIPIKEFDKTAGNLSQYTSQLAYEMQYLVMDSAINEKYKSKNPAKWYVTDLTSREANFIGNYVDRDHKVRIVFQDGNYLDRTIHLNKQGGYLITATISDT